jgi:hypothetical protein
MTRRAFFGAVGVLLAAPMVALRTKVVPRLWIDPRCQEAIRSLPRWNYRPSSKQVEFMNSLERRVLWTGGR